MRIRTINFIFVFFLFIPVFQRLDGPSPLMIVQEVKPEQIGSDAKIDIHGFYLKEKEECLVRLILEWDPEKPLPDR